MNTGSGASDLKRYSFLVVFANDGTIDDNELAFMRKLVLADGQVDDDEKKVLRNIFSRVTEADVSPGVWSDIMAFRDQYGID